MPRFVILEHDYPSKHWDFMLETESNLRTWKLLDDPHLLLSKGKKKLPINAAATFDHRLHYLDYEGPISGGRGFVKRVDCGTFEWLTQDERQVTVHLKGEKLKGLVKVTLSELTFLDGSDQGDTL